MAHCVTVPECLPERLEVISYANESAFLYNDEMEKLIDADGKLDQAHKMVGPFDQGHHLQTDFGANKLESRVLAEIMAIGKPRAETLMKESDYNIWFGTLTCEIVLTIPGEDF
ncbi:uncharacterized protein BO97DRAFT_419668 [Aspergillus homomorphus CBS 101889]|uniref:Uncharacterized protein n=1 Tax=Aspergillus homomorphus (strain CBS 101889) TaxID=1450537 RepID=A0A395IB03_ASPHC|nr:hypothetical protein BO97DRAFT_419668 [Aspergillus homomorphus CBS 101889]RAL17430.1 hypothetical protein BO97DRAFT_419668 [Aspergillus homomorphus CBS 101889]